MKKYINFLSFFLRSLNWNKISFFPHIVRLCLWSWISILISHIWIVELTIGKCVWREMILQSLQSTLESQYLTNDIRYRVSSLLLIDFIFNINFATAASTISILESSMIWWSIIISLKTVVSPSTENCRDSKVKRGKKKLKFYFISQMKSWICSFVVVVNEWGVRVVSLIHLFVT